MKAEIVCTIVIVSHHRIVEDRRRSTARTAWFKYHGQKGLRLFDRFIANNACHNVVLVFKFVGRHADTVNHSSIPYRVLHKPPHTNAFGCQMHARLKLLPEPYCSAYTEIITS